MFSILIYVKLFLVLSTIALNTAIIIIIFLKVSPENFLSKQRYIILLCSVRSAEALAEALTEALAEALAEDQETTKTESRYSRCN